MRKIIVDKKSGFRVKDLYTPIVIRDERGIIFYDTNSLLPKVESFNLPEGVYYVDNGAFTAMSEPRRYDLPKLPFAQRFFYPDVKKFKIMFGHNPNKCTVNWNKKYILFDESFKERPLPQVDFVFYHECGHRYYTTEKYCDIYAAKCMLKIGYNPSQIGFASIDSLSNRQDERKEFIIEKM